MSHSSAQSNVGSHTIYEDGDQRNPPAAEQKATAYKEGVRGSHKNLDSKDERSIANKLASQGGKPDPSHHHNHEHDPEAELSKQDPTKPAQTHGNAPSRGAQIDAELKADDEQRLREKGIKH